MCKSFLFRDAWLNRTENRTMLRFFWNYTDDARGVRGSMAVKNMLYCSQSMRDQHL